MKIPNGVTRARGKDQYSLFFEEDDVEYNFMAKNENKQWKIFFEYTTKKRMDFAKKMEFFISFFKDFQKEYKPLDVSILLKGAIGPIVNNLCKDFGYKMVTIKRLDPAENENIERNVIVLKKVKK